MTNVERSMPMYVLPYMLFSTHVPYCSATSCSSSERSVNGRPYFSRNLTCFFGLSGLTPRTTAPFRSQLAPHVADAARLRGAAGRVVLGIEVEDDRRASERGQGDRFALVGGEREVGRRATLFDDGHDGSQPSTYAVRYSGPQRAYASSGLDVSSGTLASCFAATSFFA